MACLAAPVACMAATAAHQPDRLCPSALTSAIPARQSSAPGGREFVSRVKGMNSDERESRILAELMDGNIPSFLRRLVPVTFRERLADHRDVKVTLCVAPDYVAIGSDDDYVLMPMRLETALLFDDSYGFVLPTRKLVDEIYGQAQIHLAPQPLPASAAMRSTNYYWQHNEMVRGQRSDWRLPQGTLTAGDKKDLVLTSRLWRYPERVAIYGWHRIDGRPIQPLSTLHGARYADYSHGVRLISSTAYIDDQAQPLLTLLGDPQLAPLFNDEGVIPEVARLVTILSTLKLPPRQTIGLRSAPATLAAAE
ncbi:conserved protein of unknown function [Georgfuchsia toluolica]|uniref:Uncharacterized protein n=1 Tax=Georgfuchsia toluolica TaxID=424218 RepID=A0A916N8Z7_9PROT|nr:hypothetical protein [Georgfuchsia toluolica]CAG4883210.1 conserved protein of unknown function [Georgfuchsia toluolica]